MTDQPTTDPIADLRARIVAAIRSAPFEELRTVGYSPNGPLQITARVDDLADVVLRRLTTAAASVPVSVPADGQRRARYAAALAEYECASLGCPVPDADHPYWTVWRERADAVMAVDAEQAADLVTALRGAGAERDKIEAKRYKQERGAKAEALLLRFTAEAHRRKWSYDRGLDDDGVPLKSEAFDALHRLGEEMRIELEKLRRMADEEQPASTAPLAAGLPLVKGNCPACQRASLFLGSGGYVTCSNADCGEPDAATTVLEQPAVVARQDGAEA